MSTQAVNILVDNKIAIDNLLVISERVKLNFSSLEFLRHSGLKYFYEKYPWSARFIDKHIGKYTLERKRIGVIEDEIKDKYSIDLCSRVDEYFCGDHIRFTEIKEFKNGNKYTVYCERKYRAIDIINKIFGTKIEYDGLIPNNNYYFNGVKVRYYADGDTLSFKGLGADRLAILVDIVVSTFYSYGSGEGMSFGGHGKIGETHFDNLYRDKFSKVLELKRAFDNVLREHNELSEGKVQYRIAQFAQQS